MEFPSKEPEIIRLAEKMVAGITANKTLFPNLPAPVDQFQKALTEFTGAIDGVIAAKVALDKANAKKTEKYKALVDVMKLIIGYVKNIATKDNTLLDIIGWIVKKKTILTPPGACCELKVESQGEGSFIVSFEIKEDGGKPLAFIFQRFNEMTNLWDDTVISTEQKKNLIDQPRGKELKYRVVAFNKKGTGTPSNTIKVILA